ncbi:MAG: hypothetical protein WC523_03380 [Patescibacteria group bacterium]
MQTNRRQLGLLIIIIGLIILLLIVYFGFFKKSSSPTVPSTTTEPTISGQLPTGPETASTTPGDKPRNYQKYNIAAEAAHKTNASDVAKMAMAFSERLGSYSNQSNYGNFTDLKIFMTDSFKDWADKYVETLKSQNAGVAYYGISTKAVTSEVKSFKEAAGTAEIIVTTQRRESTTTLGGGEAYTQKITIGFVKVNGEWLVDNAYWEKK